MNVVSLSFYIDDFILDEWFKILANSEFTYIWHGETICCTQEWLRCEGDSSINIVNTRTVTTSFVKIYVDEELVAEFDHDADHFFVLTTDGISKTPVALDEVRSNVLSFIEKYGVGV
ncbi:hypothetical protein Xoosp13_143 [Xanthomonas phage Xoo-sp13]|nr:hypothetical protein Xoosp13_143 [Xanthomonas phage Xoo-sp13]